MTNYSPGVLLLILGLGRVADDPAAGPGAFLTLRLSGLAGN